MALVRAKAPSSQRCLEPLTLELIGGLYALLEPLLALHRTIRKQESFVAELTSSSKALLRIN
jgi:hypothetical protein